MPSSSAVYRALLRAGMIDLPNIGNAVLLAFQFEEQFACSTTCAARHVWAGRSLVEHSIETRDGAGSNPARSAAARLVANNP